MKTAERLSQRSRTTIDPLSPRMVSDRSFGAASPEVSLAMVPERKVRQPTEKSGAITIPCVPGPLSAKVSAENAVRLSTAPNSDTSHDSA